MQSSFCLYLMHHENGNASLNKRETAHEVRGTSACADRSGDIELSSPDQRSKKRTIPIWYRSFFQARDGDRTRDPLLGKEVLHR